MLQRQKPVGAIPSKVYVRGDKIRFEVGDKLQLSSVVILDIKEQTGYMVLPSNKSYTEYAPGKIPMAMPFLRPADPENACPAWDKLVGKPGSCTKVGDDTLNGRPVVKYRGTSRNGDTGIAWVDVKLAYVVKWEGEKTAAELRGINVAPQAASLFVLPKGYERVDSLAAHQQGMAKSRRSRQIPQKPKQ